jgi:predicted negative regulator of RcsB-dependent stress response
MNGSSRFRHWIILAVCAFVPYLSGVFHGFVFDDHGTIVENAFLENPAHVWQLLSLQTIGDPAVVDGNRPMVLLSYFFDRAIWGLSSFGYHLTNLLLHILVVLLVFSLGRRIFSSQNEWGAFAAALIFALHPALTEAVQLPAYREDLLCVLFMLCCLRLSLSLARGALIGAVIFMILAILSKESAVVTPLLIGWLCIQISDPIVPRRRWMGLVMATTIVAFLFIVWWASGPSVQAMAAAWNGSSLRFPSNLLTAPWIFLQYLRLLVFPYPLAADYVVTPVTTLLNFRFVLGFLSVILLIAVMVSVKKTPLAIGLGWLLIAFLPVSNVLPLFNPMAERYLYLMAVGFVLVVGWGLQQLSSRRMASLVLAILCALLAWRTMDRVKDWEDDYSIWLSTLSAQPQSARAHTWLGLYQKDHGHREAARSLFQEADELNPQDVSGLLNLAVLAGEEGKYKEAERMLREAIRRQPKNIQAHWNLAVALFHRQDEAGMMKAVEDTLRMDPFHLPAHHARLDWLLATGQQEEAREEAKRILEIDPQDKPALQILQEPH